MGGNWDSQRAWANFGGLTLEQAHVKFRENPLNYKFRENPLNYQEDFMFMGGRAFAYYFPVIEDHLSSVSDAESEDDRQAWILAHCVRIQFDADDLTEILHLRPRVIELANFVRNNAVRFGVDDGERQRVADAWTKLIDHVEAVE